MNHFDLFSGLGGFALAARWVWGDDHNVVAFCEKDDYCQKILNKHWPDVPVIGDVRDVKTDYGRIDLLTGGFPCQPFSSSGTRNGRSDDRYLWPEMLRVVRAFQPTWVVAENVRGLLGIEDGLVFEQVCLDLEESGYEVQPFVIPAVAVDADHRRDRLWFIAHLIGGRLASPVYGQISCVRGKEKAFRRSESSRAFPENGTSGIYQPTLGRGVHAIPRRVDRIRALGNAIVPQVAEQIFRAIKAAA